ncbi:hypothetical protein AAMO2058_001444900 [Amorphochlora amoebiformis]
MVKAVDSEETEVFLPKNLKRSEKSINSAPEGERGYPAGVKYIVGNEFCERYCFYGLRSVLVLYMTMAAQVQESNAVVIMHGFIATAYLTPLLGASLSDGHIGKYKTIISLSIVYSFGSLILSYSSLAETARPIRLSGLFIGLLLIAIGTGGIKPCVSAFGGDQFEANATEQIQSFFVIFYFAINAGSVLAIIITPLLRDYGCPSGGSQCSFGLAFAIPSALMLSSVGILILGNLVVGYKQVTPSGTSPFARLLRVRFLTGTPKKITDPELKGNESFGGGGGEACTKYGKREAEEVKQVLKVIVLMSPLPLFWCLFDQQSSTWVIQASQMDTSIGAWKILPDQMQMVNALLILIFLPMFDRVVYPMMTYFGYPLRPISKMILGMAIAGIAYLAAAGVQMGIDTCPPGDHCVHILWQMPQYVLITAAEILVSVTGLEFSYSEAPKSKKSVMQSIWLLTVSIGNFLVAALEVGLVMLSVRASIGFVVNASLMALAIIWFAAVSHGYDYYQDPNNQADPEQPTV